MAKATPLKTTAQVKAYLRNVLRDAEHHAQQAERIVEPLALGLWGAKDPGTDVATRARIAWLWINGKRYAVNWSHTILKIEIRERSQQGKVVATIDNNTDPADIIALVDQLKAA